MDAFMNKIPAYSLLILSTAGLWGCSVVDDTELVSCISRGVSYFKAIDFYLFASRNNYLSVK